MTNTTPHGQVPEALQPDTALLVARNCRETGSDPSCPFFARVQLMDAAYVLERLHAENATLQQGYDAARLEIEALQARIKAMAEERADELAAAHLDGRMRAGQPAPVMFNGLTEEETMNTASYAGLTTKLAGEYPPLPKPYHVAYDDIDKEDVKCFTEGQLRAYVDADRAMRAQAAPAAQGDALNNTVRVPLDSLHADAAYLIGRLQLGTMDGARVAEIIRERIEAAKAALAAQAAPAAVAGPSEMHEAMCAALTGGRCTCERNDPAVDKAWARFCGRIGDGPDAPYPGMISAFERYYAQSFTDKDWRREASVWAAAWKQAMLAAAPTTQEAPQQEPVAWRHSKTLCLYETKAEVPLADGDEWAEPLYATPQPAPAAQGDAMTYEQSYAIRQGHEIASSDAYFEARPQIDNNDRRGVFRAGFDRGWDAARAQDAHDKLANPTPPVQVPDSIRVPLDSLHADAEYLLARLLAGTLTREQVVGVIRDRIDAARLGRWPAR